MLAVYTENPPGDEEWAEYLRVVGDLQPKDAMLILSAGGGPSLMQRRDLEEATSHHTGRVAVVTTSRIARGIVTALSWLDRNIKAFDPTHRDAAFDYLEIADEGREDLLVKAQAMAAHLGVSDKIRL